MVRCSSSVLFKIIRLAATNEIWWVTRIISSSLLKGLEIKSFAPTWKPFTISVVLFSAVRKMIGISAVLGFAFKCCATSKPLISGIITSSNTKSGFSLSTCSNACRPLLAVAIANFSFVKSTFNNNTLDITSSTMRILYSEGLISIFILYNIVFPFIYIIYLRYSLKYSTIRFKPSSSSMAGFQFSFSFASVISG